MAQERRRADQQRPRRVLPDGKGALVFASLDGNPGEESFRDSVKAIRDHFGDTVGGMQVRVTGPGGLITDVYEIFLNADIKLLIGTVLLVLVLLLLIYRSPVLPFVPLITVGFGYFVAGGILAIVANALGATLSGQATSLMVILLFGAGTDYALLLISRYREELRREPDARVALATALGETWEAIAASGLTVTLAVLTLRLRHVRRLLVVRAGARGRRVRHPDRRPDAHAGAAGRARPPRLLAARAQGGRRGAHGAWRRVAERVAAHRSGAAGVVARSSSCWPWAASSTAPASASPRTSSRTCPPSRATRCSRSTSPRGRWRRRPCSSRRRRRRPSSSPA